MITVEKTVKKHKETGLKNIILKRWAKVSTSIDIYRDAFLSGCQSDKYHTLTNYDRRFRELRNSDEIRYVVTGANKIRKIA
jgi:hypothetical protein